MGYKTAKQLGILPEEHRALIAFLRSPSLGRIISVNGHAHFYDQAFSSDKGTARDNECGTAGCIAGFVFAHVSHVQRKAHLRNQRNPQAYLNEASEADGEVLDWAGEIADPGIPRTPFLYDLYIEGCTQTLAKARKVLEKALRTGKVQW